MNVLIIIGDCLNTNSSANLCHISYINGLLEKGCNVDLLTADNKSFTTENDLKIPNVNQIYTYSKSFYDILNIKKQSYQNTNINHSENNLSHNSSLISQIFAKLKKFVRNIYGIYETNIIWYLKAKSFKTKKKYNYVISLSYPPTSHLLANYLKRKKHIISENWLQIWEDPWSIDLFACDNPKLKTIKYEEKKLLDNASDILYVSPLTLKYQQELFPENASKMRWAPLPTYYQSKTDNIDFSELHFGYFGDYNSKVRNIIPFYNVARDCNLNFTICGASDLNLVSENNITVYPRLPLSDLSVHENKSNVLVFLCNLRGGQIPGKIYQYSATNKFILFILDGTDEEKSILKEYFSEFKRYVFCDNNESSIKDAIKFIQSNTDKTELYTSIDDFEPKKIINTILGR